MPPFTLELESSSHGDLPHTPAPSPGKRPSYCIQVRLGEFVAAPLIRPGGGTVTRGIAITAARSRSRALVGPRAGRLGCAGVPRFEVIDVPAEGPARALGSDHVARPEPGTIRWIDLEAQDEGTMAVLRERFELHPLAVEDCLHVDQRPKLEEYEGHLFVVAHEFALPQRDCSEVEIHEIHCFLAERVIITIHVHPSAALAEARRRVLADATHARRGPDFLLHQLLDTTVDSVFPLMDRISDQLEELEESVLNRPGRQDLQQIFGIKHTLATMRRVMSPLRDVLAVLSKRDNPHVSTRATLYYRDVYDHVLRLGENIDLNRDLLGNALDAYLSSVANKTNEIMKRLTLFSAIFLPLTAITGFFGQNFEDMPFKSHGYFLLMLTSVAIVPPALVWWFRSKDWW